MWVQSPREMKSLIKLILTFLFITLFSSRVFSFNPQKDWEEKVKILELKGKVDNITFINDKLIWFTVDDVLYEGEKTSDNWKHSVSSKSRKKVGENWRYEQAWMVKAIGVGFRGSQRITIEDVNYSLKGKEYIWVATKDKVLGYYGDKILGYYEETKKWIELQQFIQIDKDNKVAFAPITLEEGDGYLFIGTEQQKIKIGEGIKIIGGGIYFYNLKENKWQYFTKEDGLLSNNITSLTVDRENLWIGTDKGLVKYNFKDRKFIEIKELKGKKINVIARDNDILFIATDKEMYKFKKDDLITHWFIEEEKIKDEVKKKYFYRYYDNTNKEWETKNIKYFPEGIKKIKIYKDNIFILSDEIYILNKNIWDEFIKDEVLSFDIIEDKILFGKHKEIFCLFKPVEEPVKQDRIVGERTIYGHTFKEKHTGGGVFYPEGLVVITLKEPPIMNKEEVVEFLKEYDLELMEFRSSLYGRYCVARILTDKTSDEMIEILEKDPRVKNVSVKAGIKPFRPKRVPTQTVFNDPKFIKQWYLFQDRGNGLIPDNDSRNFDINAPEAWNITQGQPIIIAVIDTGVNIEHEDIKDNLWINPGEIPGNGIDDDNNGLIDDIHGWNFGDNNSDIRDGYWDCSESDPECPDLNTCEWDPIEISKPCEWVTHGTDVAGIIAAKSDNNKGISSVCPNCKIMVLKATKAGTPDKKGGFDDMEAIVESIKYAVNKGAKIINMSYGTYYDEKKFKDKEAMEKENQPIQEAYQKGVLVIAAGRNCGISCPHYPAGYENVIEVGGTQEDGERWVDSDASSDYRVRTNLCAPAKNIYTTTTDKNQASLYNFERGTSLSTPQVSGVAGLVLSKYSNLTNEYAKKVLFGAVNNLGNPGKDDMGYGRVDAFKSIAPPRVQKIILQQDGNIKFSDGDLDGDNILNFTDENIDGDDFNNLTDNNNDGNKYLDGANSLDTNGDGVLDTPDDDGDSIPNADDVNYSTYKLPDTGTFKVYVQFNESMLLLGYGGEDPDVKLVKTDDTELQISGKTDNTDWTTEDVEGDLWYGTVNIIETDLDKLIGDVRIRISGSSDMAGEQLDYDVTQAGAQPYEYTLTVPAFRPNPTDTNAYVKRSIRERNTPMIGGKIDVYGRNFNTREDDENSVRRVVVEVYSYNMGNVALSTEMTKTGQFEFKYTWNTEERDPTTDNLKYPAGKYKVTLKAYDRNNDQVFEFARDVKVENLPIIIASNPGHKKNKEDDILEKLKLKKPVKYKVTPGGKKVVKIKDIVEPEDVEYHIRVWFKPIDKTIIDEEIEKIIRKYSAKVVFQRGLIVDFKLLKKETRDEIIKELQNVLSISKVKENPLLYKNGEMEIIADEIIIYFEPKIKEEQITEIIKRYNLIKLREQRILWDGIVSCGFKIPSEISLPKLINVLRKYPFVYNFDFNTPVYPKFPNDTHYVNHDQWHLRQDWLENSFNFDINAHKAWYITSGNRNVVIAVIEGGGFDLNHPDLAANYVDSNLWRNFDVTPPDNNPDVDAGNDHGTLVAGVAGAVGENNRGVVGVCYNCRIMPLEAETQDAAVEAINFATANFTNGVRIINMSWGVSSIIDDLRQSLQQASAVGLILVAAADNAGCDGSVCGGDLFPYTEPNVIGVGGINSDGNKRPASNWGTGVDIAAPSQDIFSTEYNDSYRSASGNSYATPQISATIGLIDSTYPNLSTSAIHRILFGAANNMGTAGYGTTQQDLGYGLVDAFKAVAPPQVRKVILQQSGVIKFSDGDLDGDNLLNFTDENIDGEWYFISTYADTFPNRIDENDDGDRELDNVDPDDDGDEILDGPSDSFDKDASTYKLPTTGSLTINVQLNESTMLRIDNTDYCFHTPCQNDPEVTLIGTDGFSKKFSGYDTSNADWSTSGIEFDTWTGTITLIDEDLDKLIGDVKIRISGSSDMAGEQLDYDITIAGAQPYEYTLTVPAFRPNPTDTNAYVKRSIRERNTPMIGGKIDVYGRNFNTREDDENSVRRVVVEVYSYDMGNFVLSDEMTKTGQFEFKYTWNTEEREIGNNRKYPAGLYKVTLKVYDKNGKQSLPDFSRDVIIDIPPIVQYVKVWQKKPLADELKYDTVWNETKDAQDNVISREKQENANLPIDATEIGQTGILSFLFSQLPLSYEIGFSQIMENIPLKVEILSEDRNYRKQVTGTWKNEKLWRGNISIPDTEIDNFLGENTLNIQGAKGLTKREVDAEPGSVAKKFNLC